MPSVRGILADMIARGELPPLSDVRKGKAKPEADLPRGGADDPRSAFGSAACGPTVNLEGPAMNGSAAPEELIDPRSSPECWHLVVSSDIPQKSIELPGPHSVVTPQVRSSSTRLFGRKAIECTITLASSPARTESFR